MHSRSESVDPPSSFFVVDDLLLDDQGWGKVLYCHCCTLIILIITIVASLVFIEYYGVNKICYKYIHPDMQTYGDFRDHNHQSFNMPIC